jgi:transcriptional regulator with XRE-family HTH domain
MSLVENIKTLCKQKNISIPKLENEFGFGHGAVYNWDKNSPSIDKLQKVAEYFGVSTDYLLGKTNIMNWEEVFPLVAKDFANEELTPDEQEKLKQYKHHLSSQLELNENAIKHLYKEEFQLVSRFRKLTQPSQAAVIALIDSLEIVDARLTKDPKKDA